MPVETQTNARMLVIESSVRDYDAVAVEVDEEIVYTRGVDEKHGGFHFKKGQKFKSR